MTNLHPTIVNPDGPLRVVVTKELPGTHWQDILVAAGCRIEIAPGTEILDKARLRDLIGERCDGAIGQLTEAWDEETLGTFKTAGGRAYSNYAVGYNNVIGNAPRLTFEDDKPALFLVG